MVGTYLQHPIYAHACGLVAAYVEKHGKFAKPKTNKKTGKNGVTKGQDGPEAGSETNAARGLGRKTWDLKNVSQAPQRLAQLWIRLNWPRQFSLPISNIIINCWLIL